LRCGLESSGFHSQMACNSTWFTSVSATSRLNRGSTSCSARRRATATWTGHAIGLVIPNRKRSP
jgi:TnpA family transposase